MLEIGRLFEEIEYEGYEEVVVMCYFYDFVYMVYKLIVFGEEEVGYYKEWWLDFFIFYLWNLDLFLL